MFEAQTYDKVLEEILSRAPDGIDLRQGSIFYDAVAGIAFKIAKYYADLEQVFEMVFLVTATGDYLTLKAEEYAVYRQAAATAKYRIKYDGELPELGTRFFCSGQYFVLAQDDALGIYIEAEKAGTEANDIPAGTSVVPTDTQRSLTACSIVEELEPGADDEDDESLRKRVQEKIAGPAENGNQQHYKTWCESISGVGRARIVPLWAGENTVKGILIDPELVQKMQTIRTKLGKAIKVTSGYRCVKHNADPKVGGSRTSRHLYGIAADWRTVDRSVNPVALGIIAAAQGFGAVGIYWHDKAAIVHTDTRGGKATWLCVQPGVYPSTTYNKFVLPTIEQGCEGAANRAATVMLQRLLGITHDGGFGPATTKALMEVQRKHGLAADGICGPKSWTVLSGADKYL